MKEEITKYIKENYPEYTIWVSNESNMISIQKIFNNNFFIPVKLIQNLMFICRINYEKISIYVGKAAIPNNYESLLLIITLQL